MVLPVNDFRDRYNYDLNGLTIQICFHLIDIQLQWVPDYLWRWSGRADHNQITMHLLIVYTCLKMWECGQYQEKGQMLEPGINTGYCQQQKHYRRGFSELCWTWFFNSVSRVWPETMFETHFPQKGSIDFIVR